MESRRGENIHNRDHGPLLKAHLLSTREQPAAQKESLERRPA
jgi:hypothetical protein